jgi:hypothetical protein
MNLADALERKYYEDGKEIIQQVGVWVRRKGGGKKV